MPWVFRPLLGNSFATPNCTQWRGTLRLALNGFFPAILWWPQLSATELRKLARCQPLSTDTLALQAT